MSKKLHVSMWVLAIVIAVGLLGPSFAESKKTVYVQTKSTSYCLSGSNEWSTYKNSYNKTGLISGIKYYDYDRNSYKAKPRYKSGRITSLTYVSKQHGVKDGSYQIKYSYAKNGFVKSIRTFQKRKKKYELLTAEYQKRDGKGRILSVYTYYLDADPEHEYTEYSEVFSYDSNGRLVKSQGAYYGSNDISHDEFVYQYDANGNCVAVLDYYVYPDYKELMYKTVYSYKKIKVSSKNYKKVLKQQKMINCYPANDF